MLHQKHYFWDSIFIEPPTSLHLLYTCALYCICIQHHITRRSEKYQYDGASAGCCTVQKNEHLVGKNCWIVKFSSAKFSGPSLTVVCFIHWHPFVQEAAIQSTVLAWIYQIFNSHRRASSLKFSFRGCQSCCTGSGWRSRLIFERNFFHFFSGNFSSLCRHVLLVI